MTHPVDSSDLRVDTVSAAAQRWRHELADLGGRNTLLWHRDFPRGTFDLTVAHPSGVAKLLAGHRTLLSEIVREQTARREALATIAAIHAKTRELHLEHGVASCFVAVGMATWHLRRAKTPPRAPVLLRCAQILPVDAAYHDFALQLDRDVVFNPVLENYLRGEAGIDFDAAALARLSASSGFDPRLTYRALEELCMDMDGFGINPQTVIATFPWAKLDLVAHLSTDPAKLAAHDLIAALAGHPRPELRAVPPATEEHDPRQELSVLDADAEQRAVITELQHGASLVLDTPAGTGATQTVANVVAGAVAQGRNALVVSQEKPALDALRRRWAFVGLDRMVLDLPEDPRRARSVIRALAAQLDDNHDEPELPDDPLPRWFEARAVLAQHEHCMHHVHEPWGQSLAQTQAAVAGLASLPQPPRSHVRWSTPVLLDLSADRVAEVKEVLTRAATAGVWQRGRTEDPWYAATLRSESEAARAAAVVENLAGSALSDARQEIKQVCRTTGLPEPLNLAQWQQRLDLLARVHETSDHFRPQIYEAPLPDLIAAVSGRKDSAAARDGDESAGERMGTVARGRFKRQVRSLLRPGKPPSDLVDRLVAARQERSDWEELAGKAARPHTPAGWEKAQDTYAGIGRDMDWLQDVLAGTASGADLATTHLDLLMERLLRLDARRNRVHVAARAYVLLRPLRETGLGSMIDDCARRGVAARDVSAEVELVYQASLLDHICEQQDEVMPPTPRVAAAAKQFRMADRDHLTRNATRVHRTMARRLSRAIAAHPGQVRALRDAAARGRADVQVVIARCPDIVLALRPVWVGSPLIIPATVPDSVRLDLTVVEHAHRSSTASCVAALGHSKQAFIVGDHQRCGPQPFSYGAHPVLPDSEGSESETSAAVSLLADASAVLTVRCLKTNYRALDQQMVRPLQALPDCSVTSFPGVGVGRRATIRMISEPEQLVPTATAAAIDLLLRGRAASVAVLTDDALSAEGIRGGVQTAAGANPLVRRALNEKSASGLLALPVVRWAGDVRDQVIWVRGPAREIDPAQVAVVLAAARRSVTVVAADRGGNDPGGLGAAMLEELLAPGRREQSMEHQGEARQQPEHPLLRDLVLRLQAEDLVVHQHVGAGPYAVPLGIEDPARPGRLLVGINLDLTPRDVQPGRDDVRLRAEQLSRLGWAPTRVLSSNLFRDPAREVAALVSLVRQASRELREQTSSS